jgi:presenilin-like A22 family membrane protease
VVYKTEIQFYLAYSKNQWKIRDLIGVITALGVNT